MKLIVGLGNPGEKYANVRHNLGFMVVDHLAADRLPSTVYGRFWKYEDKFKAEVGRLKTEDVLIAKPQTYMNNSGLAVRLLTTYYKLPSTDVIIVHDDLDLPLGKIKVILGGAAAGHHGVESIIKELGTDRFVRVRVGIGNLKSQRGEHKSGSVGFNAEHFVLEPFIHSEKAKVKHMIKQVTRVIELLLEKGLEAAQNQFN